MVRLEYLRIPVQIATIVLHVSNIVYMALILRSDHGVKAHPLLKNFSDLQLRYFTCWTFFFQTVYAAISLSCDLKTLKGKQPVRLLAYCRKGLFAGVVWPSVWMVYIVFWSVFLYDRSLIFPEILDTVISDISNHIMHSAIVPLAVWELLFLPRAVPESHKKYLFNVIMHYMLYTSIILYTYSERGLWLYPFYGLAYKNNCFTLLVITLAVLYVCLYYVQWFITSLLYGKGGKTKTR